MLPDHPASGWSDLVRRTGAISFGARPPMIAYNVNLEGEDATVAKRIAEIVLATQVVGSHHLRAQGSEQRDSSMLCREWVSPYRVKASRRSP